MKVCLVGAMLEENLALGYLAASLRSAGHTVDLMAFDGPDDIPGLVEDIGSREPAMVGMSVAFQHRVTEFRDLARSLRAAGIEAVQVWGGHIPTARPGRILLQYPWVDVVVGHDAEDTVVDLADAMEQAPLPPPTDPDSPREIRFPLLDRLTAIDGLSFRHPEGRMGSTPARTAVRDLDSLPPPSRDQKPARHAGIGFAPILSSRGCWQNCTYCSIQTYHRGRKGPRVRFRDTDKVAAEMADLYSHDNVRIFCFHDENLFLPRPARTLQRMRAIRSGLDRRGVGRVGLVAKCRPDELSRSLLEETRDMGLLRVYVGIENGSQAGLDHLGRNTTVETCRRALGQLRESRVFACFNVLLFEPETTLQDVKDNTSFLREFNDFPWNFCRTEIYPGSLLEERLRDQGRLRGGLEGLGYTIADPDAELLFRITAVAFGGRNFGPQSTANSASSLGYLAAVLRHFHHGEAVGHLVDRTKDLIQRFGADTLNFLDEATLTVEKGIVDATWVRDFTADLAGRVADHDALFWQEIEDLRRAMDRYGNEHAHELDQAPRGVRQGVARAAAVLAAATFASQGCGDKINVVDSVPPDTDVMVMDPLPPDASDVHYLDVDPAPDDIPMYDPVPPDVQDGAETEIPMYDPVPPDVPGIEDAQEAESEDVPSKFEIPPVDPLPMDQWGQAKPGTPQAALPLDRVFRVSLGIVGQGESLRLVARVKGAENALLEWQARGGTIEPEGREARFKADGTGQPMVVVTARSGTGLLDVARFFPETGNG